MRRRDKRNKRREGDAGGKRDEITEGDTKGRVSVPPRGNIHFLPQISAFSY
jgi:hypothetical protein